MNIERLNEQNIPYFNEIKNLTVTISDVKKIEERMCYDAYWEVYTNHGTVTIKTYDGIFLTIICYQTQRIVIRLMSY